MENLIPYLFIGLMLLLIAVGVNKYRKAVHGDPTKPPKKPSPKTPKKKSARRQRKGPYPGIKHGYRIIHGGVELVSLNKELAVDLEGRKDTNLGIKDNSEVWSYGKVKGHLGNLPKDIAETMEELDIAGELEIRVDHIWVGDRGRAIVRVNVDGLPAVKEKVTEYAQQS